MDSYRFSTFLLTTEEHNLHTSIKNGNKREKEKIENKNCGSLGQF
jgi:hypothetical protein